MTIEQFAGCQFHYAPITGGFEVTRAGKCVTPSGLAKQELLASFLQARQNGRLVKVDELSGVCTYAMENIWTFVPVNVLEFEANTAALATAQVSAINAGKPGKAYRVVVNGDQMRNLVMHVYARSARRAMQFAHAYTRCRWLNTKQDRLRDTRSVWISTVVLYTNS